METDQTTAANRGREETLQQRVEPLNVSVPDSACITWLTEVPVTIALFFVSVINRVDQGCSQLT